MHEVIELMKIVQDAAFHKDYVKIFSVFIKVDLHNIAYLEVDLNACGTGRLQGIFAVCLRQVKDRDLCAEDGSGDCLFTAGTADIRYTDPFVGIKVGGILS